VLGLLRLSGWLSVCLSVRSEFWIWGRFGEVDFDDDGFPMGGVVGIVSTISLVSGFLCKMCRISKEGLFR